MDVIRTGNIPKYMDSEKASYAILAAIDGKAMLSLILDRDWNRAEQSSSLEAMIDRALSR